MKEASKRRRSKKQIEEDKLKAATEKADIANKLAQMQQMENQLQEMKEKVEYADLQFKQV